MQMSFLGIQPHLSLIHNGHDQYKAWLWCIWSTYTISLHILTYHSTSTQPKTIMENIWKDRATLQFLQIRTFPNIVILMERDLIQHKARHHSWQRNNMVSTFLQDDWIICITFNWNIGINLTFACRVGAFCCQMYAQPSIIHFS